MVRRRVAGSGQGLRQELGILLFGEIHIFVCQHFRDHVHAEFAAVGEAYGKVMPQPWKGRNLGGRPGRLAEAVNRCAVFAHLAVFAGENIGAAPGKCSSRHAICSCNSSSTRELMPMERVFLPLGSRKRMSLRSKATSSSCSLNISPRRIPVKKASRSILPTSRAGHVRAQSRKRPSFFRRQMLNNLIVLNGHFDLKGKIGAAVGLDAKIDDAPQKLQEYSREWPVCVLSGICAAPPPSGA